MTGMMRAAAAFLLFGINLMQAQYSAERIRVEGYEVVRLADAGTQTEVRVIPSFGNNAYQMTIRGQNIFWCPHKTLQEWHQKPALCGNPLLAPWANRIDRDSYFANAKEYLLNPKLGNVRRDGNGKPIHGLLIYAAWDVVEVRAGEREAMLRSRLEFWRRPDWMAQFPFAHNLEVTHRLRDGVLEVETVIENLSDEAMPVAVGYHPYFQVTDAPRDDWTVHLAAREQLVLSQELIPTGERKPIGYANPVKLAGTSLDDGFTSLTAGADGRAVFWVQGKQQKVEVVYGPKYPVAVVYAPPGRPFICFEPMSGPTNAFNLAHESKFSGLQTIPPRGQWRESFWVRPSGF